MTREEVLAFCLNLPTAEQTYPFGEEVAVVKVGGKMFALVPLSEESAPSTSSATLRGRSIRAELTPD